MVSSPLDNWLQVQVLVISVATCFNGFLHQFPGIYELPGSDDTNRTRRSLKYCPVTGSLLASQWSQVSQWCNYVNGFLHSSCCSTIRRWQQFLTLVGCHCMLVITGCIWRPLRATGFLLAELPFCLSAMLTIFSCQVKLDYASEK